MAFLYDCHDTIRSEERERETYENPSTERGGQLTLFLAEISRARADDSNDEAHLSISHFKYLLTLIPTGGS